MKLGIVAGEASGDLLGGNLIKALQATTNDPLQCEGLGGPTMIAAGCRSLYEMDRLSMMGFFEPMMHLPDLLKLRNGLYQHFVKFKPDVFVGIDAPDFNLGLEIKLRKAGIPIVHYVSPSVWAWRQKRIFKIAQAVDLMLTLFPFEKKIYEEHGIAVECVGHPLADQIPLEIDTKAARHGLEIDENATWVALLPGSRKQEIRYMAKTFLQAAHECFQKRPDLRFITSLSNTKRHREFLAYFKKYTPDLPLTVFLNRSHQVMAAADIVMVGSGTATLETMLYKKPMVIAYRMSPVTYQLARRIVKTPYIGLPNLVANELLVPELIQGMAKPEKIAQLVLEYLDYPKRVIELKNKFTELHKSLRMDSARRAAAAINKLVQHSI